MTQEHNTERCFTCCFSVFITEDIDALRSDHILGGQQLVRCCNSSSDHYNHILTSDHPICDERMNALEYNLVKKWAEANKEIRFYPGSDEPQGEGNDERDTDVHEDGEGIH